MTYVISVTPRSETPAVILFPSYDAARQAALQLTYTDRTVRSVRIKERDA